MQAGMQKGSTCMTWRMGGVAALAAQAAWRLNTSSQNCSASTCVLSVKQRSDVNRYGVPEAADTTVPAKEIGIVITYIHVNALLA